MGRVIIALVIAMTIAGCTSTSSNGRTQVARPIVGVGY
jgi:hypothetical protein